MFRKLWSREARFQERKAYRKALREAKRLTEMAKESHRATEEAWARWWGSFQVLQAYAKHLEKLVSELQEERHR